VSTHTANRTRKRGTYLYKSDNDLGQLNEFSYRFEEQKDKGKQRTCSSWVNIRRFRAAAAAAAAASLS